MPHHEELPRHHEKTIQLILTLLLILVSQKIAFGVAMHSEGAYTGTTSKNPLNRKQLIMFGLFGQKQEIVNPRTAPVIPTPEAYGLTEQQQLSIDALIVDEDNMVQLGEVTRNLINMQCQYGSRYLDQKLQDSKFLGEGLRFNVEGSSYHDYRLNKDDVLEFVARVRQYRWNIGQVEVGTI